MQAALLTLQAGVPQTLATTAFVSALADGLSRIGIETRVVGLTTRASQWRPEALGAVSSAAPWIDPPSPSLRDEIAAARLGIFDEELTPEPTGGEELPRWYLEVLLERELGRFAGDDELAVIAYVPVSYPTIDIVARIARRRRWKLVVQSCESLSGRWMNPSVRDDYVRVVAEAASGVWALSSFLADYWEAHGVPAHRVLVQPNVVRLDAFAVKGTPCRGEGLYLGNLSHHEVEQLLEISESVKRSIPDFRLVLYGDATDERREELAALVARRGLTGIASIKPSVLPSEVPAVLKDADVLLLPRASGEFSAAGFPNKLGEYLASGRPVVVTKVGDIPKYLVDGRDAFLVDPDDVAAFSQTLAIALSDHTRADAVGARGKCVAKRLFASPAVAQRIMEFIEALPPRAAGSRLTPARLMRRTNVIAGSIRGGWSARARGQWSALLKWITYAPSGHTRVMALKILVVRVLRFLHLKPPAPGA